MMGKKKRPSSGKSVHELPLDEEVKRARMAKPMKQHSDVDGINAEDEYSGTVNEKMTKKILSAARKQKTEIDLELGGVEVSAGKSFLTDETEGGKEGVADEDVDEVAEDVQDELMLEEELKKWDGHDLTADNVTEEEEKAMELFVSKSKESSKQSRVQIQSNFVKSNQITIYDKYLEALAAKRGEVDDALSESQTNGGKPALDPRVVSVYRGVGQVMAKYRSGKIPKAFKVLPVLKNWEELLFLTKPHEWSAASVYQAVRRFSSSANEKVAQRFYNLILLPRIRDDIAEYKRLNFFLYMAIKKALHKVGAFFKGFLLPLCEEGDCTLREAVIISSVLAKCSIPVLHSSAAMLKIAEMNFSGANSIFLKTFFGKKYALPYRVIDATVHHFMSFMDDQRDFPVLWHQCFLTFVQLYKNSFSNEQKEQLMRLTQKHCHKFISPQIQRELQTSINKFPENYTQKDKDETMSESSK